MKSNYWVKLYHEINYDMKLFNLSDRLFMRFIRCLALAGEVGDGGLLPPIDEIAFIFRTDAELVETELFNLTEHSLISLIDGRYYVTNFTKWQRARTATERKQSQRKSEKKQHHYTLHDGHEPVTTCDTEKEVELKEEDRRSKALEIYKSVTNLTPDYYKQDPVIDGIWSVIETHELDYDPLIEYLKKHYDNWCNSRTEKGRKYNPSNPKWLEWAITNFDNSTIDKAEAEGYRLIE